MSRLKDLGKIQRQFRELLHTSLTSPGDLRLPEDFRALLSKPHRFNVYTEAYAGRLLSSLRINFSICRKLLGQDEFDTMARTFFEGHPPASFTLNDLGRELPVFLSNHPLISRFPFLAELARLEREIVLSHTADDQTCTVASELSEISDEELISKKILLKEDVRLFESAWPVDLFFTEDQPPASLCPSETRILIERSPQGVTIRDCDTDEFGCLVATKSGATLSVIFAGNAEQSRQWTMSLCQEGLLTGLL